MSRGSTASQKSSLYKLYSPVGLVLKNEKVFKIHQVVAKFKHDSFDFLKNADGENLPRSSHPQRQVGYLESLFIGITPSHGAA